MPLTMEAVEAAMDEFDLKGEAAFLGEYHFGKPREYWVVSPYRTQWLPYPTKPIAAVALGWRDINGGYHTRESACRQLEELGYLITDADGLPLSDTPSALEKLMRLRIGELDATERTAIVNARIGQEIFRQALLRYWHGSCPFTHLHDPALLQASHIKPWSESDATERLDVYNGILLSALWDAAFDNGLITFTNGGELIASAKLSKQARKELNIPRNEAYGLTKDITRIWSGTVKQSSSANRCGQATVARARQGDPRAAGEPAARP